MRTKTHILIALLILINATLSAADKNSILTFFIGDVIIKKEGKAGIPASAGIQLGINDIIKTGKNSQAEITVDGKAFYLNENKSARVRDLNTRENTSPLFNAMKKISKSSVKSRFVIIAGIRAERKDEDVIWSDDKTLSGYTGEVSIINDDSKLERMSEMISDNRFTAAWDFYLKVKVSPVNKNRFDFMGGAAGYNLCNYGDAAKIFRSLAETASDTQVKIEAAFYAGLSLNAMLKYNESIPFLTAYISSGSESGNTAQAYFLRGVSFLNIGDKVKAREDLSIVISKYSADPVAEDAERLLKNIK